MIDFGGYLLLRLFVYYNKVAVLLDNTINIPVEISIYLLAYQIKTAFGLGFSKKVCKNLKL